MMFKIYEHGYSSFYIARDLGNHIRDYLHSDGEVFGTKEYWPTRELAQAVLNKYQPPHVWDHGDVFRTKHGMLMICFGFYGLLTPKAFCLNGPIMGPVVSGDPFERATFLFNIREKL